MLSVERGLLQLEEKDTWLDVKRCALVFYRPAQRPRKAVAAISWSTYQENRQEIEAIRQETRLKYSWITLALADKLLVSVGKSWETGLEYYKLLTARLPPEVWAEVRLQNPSTLKRKQAVISGEFFC